MRTFGTTRPAPSFLLAGRDVLVRLSEVVVIVDQQACAAAATREFLGHIRRKGALAELTVGEPLKSAVVCRNRVLLSPFSTATLRRRLEAHIAF